MHAMALRATWRRWRRRPLIPALAVGILTIGTGVSTAVLAIGYAALLRPLPYPSPADLVVVTSAFPSMKLQAMGLSAPEATELAALTTTFDQVGFGYGDDAAVTGGTEAVQAQVAVISWSLIAALRPRPIAGRLFSGQEDRPGDRAVAVMGEGFWRSTFGADRDIVGRSLSIDGRSTEIVGVLPASVTLAGRRVDLWLPMRYDAAAATNNRANHAFTVIGRKKSNISLAQLRLDLDRATERWSEATGAFHTPSARFHPLAAAPLADSLQRAARPATVLLIGAVALVLAASLANVATLLITSAESQRIDFAVRAALGAGTGHLWRLQAAEAFLLCAAASVPASLLAGIGGRWIAAVAPPDLARLDLVLPMWQVAAIAAGVGAGAAALCAVIRPVHPARVPLTSLLASESRAGTAGPGKRLVRRGLVGVELAVAVSLLAGAVALVQSFRALVEVDPGFTPSGVLRGFVNLPEARYGAREAIDGFYDRLQDELRQHAAVQAVGVMSGLPPMRRANNTSMLPDTAIADMHVGLPPIDYIQFVSPGVFATLRIPLLQGRLFTDADRNGAQPVALLNERAARSFFPGADPVGRRIRAMGAGLPWITIVGVVGDVHQGGLDRPPGTEIFLPLRQAANVFGTFLTRDLHVVVRLHDAAGPDEAMLASHVRAAVRRLDAGAALSEVEPMPDAIVRSAAAPRFLASVLTAFAGVALVLSASGLYGVLAHAVAARTREIGIRRALGAPGRRVLALVLADLAPIAAGGIVLGLVASAIGLRALQPFMFAGSATDPWRLAAAAGSVAAMAIAACAVPFFRAVRIDPAVALRQL